MIATGLPIWAQVAITNLGYLRVTIFLSHPTHPGKVAWAPHLDCLNCTGAVGEQVPPRFRAACPTAQDTQDMVVLVLPENISGSG